MFKINALKTKLVIASIFTAALTVAAYCIPLRTASGSAQSEFFHYEVGNPTGDDARSCECWFVSTTPRTLRCYAKYKDRYNVWHDCIGTPFTLTNTLSATVVSESFTPCDNVLAIQAYIMEGNFTRAVSNWY